MPEQGLLTYADLWSFPDDGLRRELLDGELVVSPSPFMRHQEILLRLGVLFANYVASHGGGRVFIAPLDVVLSDHNVLEPDIFFVADDRREILARGTHVFGAPSLAVEVVSNSRMDRVRKRDIYARFGIPEYWVVDPDADRVEVYRLEGDRYAKPEVVESPDVLTYGPLPGLHIDLTELFARD